jgi:hypothetical protein
LSTHRVLSITNVRCLTKRWLDYCQGHPVVAYLAKFLPIFALFWIVSWVHLDPDFGWHLQAGNYIRQFGIPAHDIFTYTAHNFRWIDHEWGNDVIMSWLYQLGRYWLLVTVFAALWTLSLFINGSKAWFGVLVLAAAAMTPYSYVRAITWSVLLLAVLIRLARSRSSYVRWLIPLLFALWANLHAGFVIGFVYIIYLAIKERKLRWLLILVLAVAASFCNPYGPRLYVEIWRTLSDSSLHSEINEWFPFRVPLVTAPFVVLWGFGYAFYALYTKRRFWKWFPFSTVLLAASLSATRNFPLFVSGSIQDTKKYLDTIRRRFPKKIDNLRKWIVALIILAIAGTAAVGFYDIMTWSEQYPSKAVAYLDTHPCSGNLFNAYDYGGYLIWKLPSEPVYIDGRMPSWRNSNGVKYLTNYTDIILNKQFQQAQFAEYNIRCAVITNDYEFKMLITDLGNDHWETVVKANQAILLIAPPGIKS